ncbi:MAG: DUF1294 domain-containing protein [Lachnospiraceae bacterium]|nr:DUF1294 domain-containing protein [Lachnospiraceae bacterium]MCI7595346.1 DUF1294 domain-containing protein [Lachnospiraceae bacterium]MDD7051767.1 DUF1294 domain-containing protein [Lachnospiraceae bacterium]MDY3223160.1 DUF1294 domain-containing protein [Lachnospiraceae bacterium]MDY4096581.1 DUF1294 domain-containing protein [Lachnospiraceae bacterium]
MNVIFVLLGYLILINLVGFTAMFLDKRRARRGAFRIPESTLFTIAFMGGSLGSLIGMYLFHHKTRHRSFTVGIPLLLILQLFILIFLYLSPVQFKFL